MRTGTHLRRPGKQPFRDDAIDARDRLRRTIGKRNGRSWACEHASLHEFARYG
jgi:hypothetical protein